MNGIEPSLQQWKTFGESCYAQHKGAPLAAVAFRVDPQGRVSIAVFCPANIQDGLTKLLGPKLQRAAAETVTGFIKQMAATPKNHDNGKGGIIAP